MSVSCSSSCSSFLPQSGLSLPFEKVCDSQVWELLLHNLFNFRTVDGFREMHRTFSLVNKYFYDKVHNNRNLWQTAYDLTFLSNVPSYNAIHVGPVTPECESIRDHYTRNGSFYSWYYYDPTNVSCQNGYLLNKGSTFRTWLRCNDMSHYNNDLKRKPSRFKNLFRRTAKRYLRKNLKSQSFLQNLRREIGSSETRIRQENRKIEKLKLKCQKIEQSKKYYYNYV